MTRLLAVGQLGLGVFLAGHALFLFRMTRSIGRDAPPGEARGRLETGLASARFPGSPLSLAVIGWVLVVGFSALGVAARLLAGTGGPGASVAVGALLAVTHLGAWRWLRPGVAAAFLAVVLTALVVEILPSRGLSLYAVALAAHLLAAASWLGHMFYWSLISGPSLKRLPDRELGGRLRSLSLEGGGLGWPALAVLAATGAYFLAARGLSPADLVAPAFLAGTFGRVLDAKLVLVAAMVGFQAVFGHREAPRAIYVNMLAAALVLALAVLLTGV